MRLGFLIAPVAALGLAATIGGCSTAPVQTAYGTLPQYCTQNNTATGAVVGTLLGAALGAAVGGWRGAAIGGGSGLVLGSLTGAQADNQCRQLAYAQALEMAEAAQAQAMAQAAAANQPPPAQVNYPTVAYVQPSDHVQRKVKVVKLNSYSSPAGKTTCAEVQDVSFGDTAAAGTNATRNVCKTASGQLQVS
jgi:hypothetical protein